MSFKGTTIIAVKKDGHVAIAGDGQVTAGDTIMKGNARKVRRIFDDKIRMDKGLRRLEAMILVSDGNRIFLISGTGDVLEPEFDAIAIGSGGNYALSAARAYLDCAKELSAREIALKAMAIASTICIYTDDKFLVEEI